MRSQQIFPLFSNLKYFFSSKNKAKDRSHGLYVGPEFLRRNTPLFNLRPHLRHLKLLPPPPAFALERSLNNDFCFIASKNANEYSFGPKQFVFTISVICDRFRCAEFKFGKVKPPDIYLIRGNSPSWRQISIIGEIHFAQWPKHNSIAFILMLARD